MKPTSSIIFSARELRTLKKVYTFRKVAESITADIALNTQRNTYIFYGSRDALSPSQYSIFRAFINKNVDKNKVQIKIELLPTTVFKSFMQFSQLQKRQVMLKGSIYQIKVIIPINSKGNSFNDEAVLYKTLFMLFNQVKQVQFTEKTFFDYRPSLYFSTSKGNPIVPRRFGQLLARAKPLQFNHEASLLIRSNLVFLQDKLNSKTNYLAE